MEAIGMASRDAIAELLTAARAERSGERIRQRLEAPIHNFEGHRYTIIDWSATFRPAT